MSVVALFVTNARAPMTSRNSSFGWYGLFSMYAGQFCGGQTAEHHGVDAVGLELLGDGVDLGLDRGGVADRRVHHRGVDRRDADRLERGHDVVVQRRGVLGLTDEDADLAVERTVGLERLDDPVGCSAPGSGVTHGALAFCNRCVVCVPPTTAVLCVSTTQFTASATKNPATRNTLSSWVNFTHAACAYWGAVGSIATMVGTSLRPLMPPAALILLISALPRALPVTEVVVGRR